MLMYVRMNFLMLTTGLSCLVFTESLGVYTVEDVVDKLGFGLFQFGVIMFAGATWV